MKWFNIYFCIIFFFLSAHQVNAGQVFTLQDCKKLAVENNIRVKNSKLELASARQVKKAAFTQYFPKVSAGGLMFDASKYFIEAQMPGGNLPVYDGNPANLQNAGQFAYFPSSSIGLLEKGTVTHITATQPVYAGGRIVNGNKLAEIGKSVQEYSKNITQNTIMLETEKNYWQIVALDEKSKTIKDYQSFLERLLMQVKDAYHSGIVMKNDVLKVNLELQKILLDQSKLDHGKQLARMAFCQHLGISYDQGLILNENLVIHDLPESLYIENDQALRKRDEYALLELSVKAEKLQTRMKIGEYLPQIAVGVSGQWLKFDDQDGKNIEVAFGTVSIPLSDWWGGSHEVRERRIKERIAENNQKDKSELLILQMEKAWQDVTDTYQQVKISEDSLKQAQENLKVNQASYDNGLTTLSDFLEAQALLQQAKDQLTDAKTTYLIKKSEYLNVTGRQL
jgi:outer membrane protein TolC